MRISNLEPKYAIADIWITRMHTLMGVSVKGVLIDVGSRERGRWKIQIPESEIERLFLNDFDYGDLKKIEDNWFWCKDADIDEG